MKFNDIHGTDWDFTSPDGESFRSFAVSGFGSSEKQRKAAEEFERDHPDWTKEVEHF